MHGQRQVDLWWSEGAPLHAGFRRRHGSVEPFIKFIENGGQVIVICPDSVDAQLA